jgi:hypothetical protein
VVFVENEEKLDLMIFAKKREFFRAKNSLNKKHWIFGTQKFP